MQARVGWQRESCWYPCSIFESHRTCSSLGVKDVVRRLRHEWYCVTVYIFDRATSNEVELVDFQGVHHARRLPGTLSFLARFRQQGRNLKKSLTLSAMLSPLSRFSSVPLTCSRRASIVRTPRLTLTHESLPLRVPREFYRRGILPGGVQRSFGTGDESSKDPSQTSKGTGGDDEEGGMIWGVAFFAFCLGVPLLTMTSDMWMKAKTDKSPWERRKSALKSWF
jgi:hypothetical protein